MNSRLCLSSSRLYISSCIIIHHHTRSLLLPSSIPWILVSKQSSPVDSLSGSQSSPALLSGQNSSILLSPYLGLQESPTLLSFQLFQNYSRRIHTSGPIVSGNLQRPVSSSLALLVSNLRHIVCISWLILITRLTTVQKRRSSCVQSIGCSSPLNDIQRWSSLMLRQIDNL